jgi:hypothetical protein
LVFRVQIKTRVARVGLQLDIEHQLCVPTVALEGKSYRFKEAKERAERKAKARSASSRKKP